MSKLSFIDKLAILYKLSLSSKIFIILFVLLVILGILFITTNSRTKKRNRQIYAMTTIFISAFIILGYHGSLAKMFDYMMDNFFIIVYFPNIAIYLAAIIATNIILWISVFNSKTSNLIKNTNIVIYVLMNYLLVLLLYTVNSGKLDIFNQSSIYGDKSATVLIELSSILFIVWIIFLILYKMILTYLKKDEEPEVKVIKKVVKEVKEIKEENIETKEEKKVQEKTRIVETQKPIPDLISLYQEPVKKEQPKLMSREEHMLRQYSNMLSLDDYKLIMKILKEQKDREKLELEKEKQYKNENAKYEELLSLYR